MYLHFQDWSEFSNHVNLPPDMKGDRVIKVYATDLDPRKILVGRSALKVIEADSDPFPVEEAHTYAGDRTWLGRQFEEELEARELRARAKRAVRALFRFSEGLGLCQATMAVKNRGGAEKDRELPIDELGIHIDLISTYSLWILKDVVDYKDPAKVLSIDEGTILRERRA